MAKTTKLYFLFPAALLCYTIFLASCQKELEGSTSSFGCKIQQWNELDSAGNLTASFAYQYDTVTGKPNLLLFRDVTGGGSRTIAPVFLHDTVFFDLGSYAVLDASSRITHLEELNSSDPAVADGSYFYTYDPNGHLAKRIFDDGTGAETTTFTFSGNDLSRVDEPLSGVANAISTTFTYSASTAADYFQYAYGAVLPELQLFLPCFNIGTISSKMISKRATVLNVPVSTPVETVSYGNYQFDTHGYIKKMTLRENFNGFTDTTTTAVEGNYQCR